MPTPVKKISIAISESIGSVSALIATPDRPKAVLLLAHGAGANMMHSFMEELSAELVALKIAVVRYNFPFMENKKGRPDPPAIAEKTVSVMMEKAHELFSKFPLYVSGKSFGGRMSSQKLSKECPPYVKGMVFYGFPLHPAGKPSIDRATHLNAIKIPLLFLQGTRDALAQIDLVESVCAKLVAPTLIKFEGADHSFKAGKQKLIPELAKATKDWMNI